MTPPTNSLIEEKLKEFEDKFCEGGKDSTLTYWVVEPADAINWLNSILKEIEKATRERMIKVVVDEATEKRWLLSEEFFSKLLTQLKEGGAK